jgi:hypothetical protein
MGNVHYQEILDCALGWFGYDVSKDDTDAERSAEPAREAQRPEPQDGQGAAPAPVPAAVQPARPQPLPERAGEKAPAVRVLQVVQKKC